jgi:hypothetical protein
VSDPKKLTPAQTMRAIQEEAAQDAIDEIKAMSPSEVDASLREAGVDPDEAAQRAKAAIEAALAGARVEPARTYQAAPAPLLAVAEPPGPPWGSPPAVPAPTDGTTNGAPKVASLDAARVRRSRLGIWAVIAAAAATVGVLATGGGGGVSAPRPPPEELARKERAEAFAACERKDYAACERSLDEAKDDDPAGEDDARVKDARAAIARWRESHPPEAPKP